MRVSRALAPVLVRSVADHDWSAPPAGIDDLVRGRDLTHLPAAAAFHGVAGCVHHSLRDNPLVVTSVADALSATHHRAVLTHLQALADLREITPALDALGAPWLVVKGPVLSEHAYPRPDLRGYTDLDLVVPARWLEGTLSALEQLGARVLDENWDLLRTIMAGEVHLVTTRGTPVDLHWHLLNDAARRDVLRIRMPELHDRARRVPVADFAVPTLDPVDTLVHLGLHGCLSGANRLVWLKDIEQVIARDAPAWDDVIARSHAYGAGLAVGSMLEATRAVLGTALPPDVARELAGSRVWPAVVATMARAGGVARASGRRSALRLVARATRTDARSSARELARRSATALRHPLTRWPDRGDAAPANARSMFRPAGSRAEFVAAVERTAD